MSGLEKYSTGGFFVRAGIQAKHIVLGSRKGLKLLISFLIRVIYFFIPLTLLYKCGQKLISKYNGVETTRVSNLSGTDGGKTFFPKDTYKEYVEHTFDDYTFSIVKDYDLVLRKNYGNYMELPPKEQRVSKHPIVELKLE